MPKPKPKPSSRQPKDASKKSVPRQDNRVVREFDPGKQHRVIRDRFHTFDLINERFARQFRISVFHHIRKQPEINVKSMEFTSYNNYANSMQENANINLVQMKPLTGTALITFPRELIFLIVETRFGGDGTIPDNIEPREFSSTENRVIQEWLGVTMRDYEAAWRSIFELNINWTRSEQQARFANITNSPTDVVAVTTFDFVLGDFHTEFSICIPYGMLEPVRELLLNPVVDGNNEDRGSWESRLASEVKQTEIDLSVEFVRFRMTMDDLVGLEVGDIVPIELPELVTGRVDGVPVMKCKYGKAPNGHIALKVDRVFDHARDPFATLVGIKLVDEQQHNIEQEAENE